MNIVQRTISSTKSTPEVNLNPEGFITIKGRSMNGNFAEFLNQIEEWVDLYLLEPADTTCFDIYLEYLDTSNFKFYASLFKKFTALQLKDKKIIVNWYYEEGDEDIVEKGEDISTILNIPFNFIVLSEKSDI